MDTSKHNLSTLFDQLGLASDEKSIEAFTSRYSPLPREIALQDASFWSEGQSQFLEEGLEDDSDWAEVIDELDAMMRH
ncbi:DUF2789 domain-containing protein [Marinobacter sp. 2_MG-2023]|uniref:DUF2789 domain-containing protein n=1 Tax=Marinobacter sp. 2_MG-2023 TaxID=3062679 RepID=UPI0026E1EBC5|nr:DUF2789 domain-containing protein [Marinobacter sp. 2_MG-2023]MDO6443531.1 DUF2789 domain-containing protein [Marinobacter sp. 2_MG-2023]